MDEKTGAKWAVSVFALFVSGIAMAYRGIMSHRLRHHIHARGRVISSMNGSLEGNSFRTVFSIPADSGDEIECSSQTNQGYLAGTAVPVLHPEGRPSAARIYEPFTHRLYGSWILYAMLALLWVAQMGWIPDE